jgi:hypothetical protein
MKVKEVERQRMDQEKAIQSSCKYYGRCGKARNGPGKGNPKQMQVKEVEKHGMGKGNLK